MELTFHGYERVFDRTRLRPEDVLLIIQTGLTHSLGEDDDFRYLCFHSFPDRQAKIAVVSKDTKRLVSIWNIGYALPIGIMLPTPEMCLSVRTMLINWLITHTPRTEKKPAKTDWGKFPEKEGVLSFGIYLEQKSVYSGERIATLADVWDKKTLEKFLRTTLLAILETLEEHWGFGNAKPLPQCKVKIKFHIEGKLVREITFIRHELMKLRKR